MRGGPRARRLQGHAAAALGCSITMRQRSVLEGALNGSKYGHAPAARPQQQLQSQREIRGSEKATPPRARRGESGAKK